MLIRPRSAWLAFCALTIVTIVTLPAVYSNIQLNGTNQVFKREDAYIAQETLTDHFRGAVLVGKTGRLFWRRLLGGQMPNFPLS